MFDAVEINSTFHRPHRPATFASWAASVPETFRFSVKVPRTITHDHKLVGANALMVALLKGIEALAPKLGCLLVQLPPSLELAPRAAHAFFRHLRLEFSGNIAVEPRHVSWLTPAADRLLDGYRVARVVADPLRAPAGIEPGGWRGLAYFRLHGSPRIYYSSYEDEYLERLAFRLQALQREGIECWCVFDNTTLGAATANALSLRECLSAKRHRAVARKRRKPL